MMLYERERKLMKKEFLAAGFTERQHKELVESAQGIVKALGFESPMDVRRVADRFGRREFVRKAGAK